MARGRNLDEGKKVEAKFVRSGQTMGIVTSKSNGSGGGVTDGA